MVCIVRDEARFHQSHQYSGCERLVCSWFCVFLFQSHNKRGCFSVSKTLNRFLHVKKSPVWTRNLSHKLQLIKTKAVQIEPWSDTEPLSSVFLVVRKFSNMAQIIWKLGWRLRIILTIKTLKREHVQLFNSVLVKTFFNMWSEKWPWIKQKILAKNEKMCKVLKAIC